MTAPRDPKRAVHTMMEVNHRIRRIHNKETHMQIIRAVTITHQDDWKSFPMSSPSWAQTRAG